MCLDSGKERFAGFFIELQCLFGFIISTVIEQLVHFNAFFTGHRLFMTVNSVTALNARFDVIFEHCVEYVNNLI